MAFGVSDEELLNALSVEI